MNKHLQRIKIISLIALIIFCFFVPASSAQTRRATSLQEDEYWQVLGSAYDGYINKQWSEKEGYYVGENNYQPWLKANQAMLLFHTMRAISEHNREEDNQRARILAENLIKDFNYSVKVKNVYKAKRPLRTFRIKKQYEPHTLKVYVGGKKIKRKDYTIKNSKIWGANKYIKFLKNIPAKKQVSITYKTRKEFRTTLDSPDYRSHLAWNYQTAEALYYAFKYSDKLGLSIELKNKIKKVLNDLTKFSYEYEVTKNQYGLAWNSGILRFAYAASKNRASAKKWSKDMKLTLESLNKKEKNKLSDLDEDFTLNYKTNNENDPLAWDAQEYSNIVLRALDDINFFRKKGFSLYSNKKLPFLFGLRQHDLGNFMLNGYPNWDTSYGLNRQFFSQYWPYSLYTLKTIIATPEFNMQNSDHGYARYLLDQAIITFSEADTLNKDPEDGAIPKTVLSVKLATRDYSDNNKITANADFLGQMSLLINEYNIFSVDPIKPQNMWHWAHKQQKLSISTPSYSTTIIGSTNGKPDKRKIGLPYGGFEITTLMKLDNTSFAMNRPGSALSSFNLSVIDENSKKPLFNSYNALVGTQAHYANNKRKPLVVSNSPNGNLKNLKPYRLKKFNFEFEKIKIDGFTQFDKKRFSFNNSHTFYNDGILLSENISLRRNRKIKQQINKHNIRVSKSFPASNHIDSIVAATNGNDTIIYQKNGNIFADFTTVKELKYLHYKESDSGLLIIPNTIDWGNSAYISVGDSDYFDNYNTLGVRPVNFIIQSGQPIDNLTFSVFITFTDGTKQDALDKYNLFKART